MGKEMREEDKSAFIEEYLELCRKYGWFIDSVEGPLYSHLFLNDYNFEDYSVEIRDLV